MEGQMENIKLAIECIKTQKQFVDETTCKAFDLAISALEFRERYDQFWEEVKAAGIKGKETEIHHSGRVFKIREVTQ